MSGTLSDPKHTGGEKLDDIMLAMDVVDTLRHEHIMVERDLAAEDRRAALITRLRGIYSAQGIEVPDAVLMDGVMALEEQRFAYTAPKKGLGTSLAKLYIRRRKWLPLFYTLSFIILGVLLINYAGFVRPAQLEAKRAEVLLSETLPANLSQARDKAVSLAKTDNLKARAEALYAAGQTALSDKNAGKAQTAANNLKQLAADLSQDYTLRIVSRPGEMSGVFRLSAENENVRNYYLIVEAIDAAGQNIAVNVSSEEDQRSARVKIWGIRVPEAVFNKVAADKRDDQIIQNAVVGIKKRGLLEPEYSITANGGTILTW